MTSSTRHPTFTGADFYANELEEEGIRVISNYLSDLVEQSDSGLATKHLLAMNCICLVIQGRQLQKRQRWVVGILFLNALLLGTLVWRLW